jgi:hypothetical protein
MIGNQMGMHNRSEMVTVQGSPYVLTASKDKGKRMYRYINSSVVN